MTFNILNWWVGFNEECRLISESSLRYWSMLYQLEGDIDHFGTRSD